MQTPYTLYIFELVLRAVFEAKIMSSSAPTVVLFDRFKSGWKNIDQGKYETFLSDPMIAAQINDVAEDVKEFCLNQLSKPICRGDYKQFLKLIVVFLGGQTNPNAKETFKQPGATHHARWLSKANYALQIFLFKSQFILSNQDRNRLGDVCVFLVRLYVKVWFKSSIATLAPNTDLNFVKDIIAYERIDPNLSKIMLNKFARHLWYIADEQSGLSFFDETISIETKRKMVASLQCDALYGDIDRVVAPIDVIRNSFPSKTISDFVSKNTMKFFERFGIDTEFLRHDPCTKPTRLQARLRYCVQFTCSKRYCRAWSQVNARF